MQNNAHKLVNALKRCKQDAKYFAIFVETKFATNGLQNLKQSRYEGVIRTHAGRKTLRRRAARGRKSLLRKIMGNNAVFVGVNTRNKSAGDFMNSASEQLKSVRLLSLENNAATYNL